METSILSAVFHAVPESIALVFLALVLLRAKVNWSIILMLGVVQAFAVFLVRQLPFLTFGVHTVILVLILIALVICISKQKFLKVAFVVLLSFTVLLLFEFIITYTFVFVTGISFDVLVEDQLLKIVMGTPQWILVFLVGFIIQHFRSKK